MYNYIEILLNVVTNIYRFKKEESFPKKIIVIRNFFNFVLLFLWLRNVFMVKFKNNVCISAENNKYENDQF